jgi:hypothetical protein
VYGREDDLIYKLLGFTSVLQVLIQFYKSLRSLQAFLSVVSAFARTRALPTLLS